MTAYRLPSGYDAELTEPACDWLTANGIEPRTVPTGSEVTITDGLIAYYELIRERGIRWEARQKPLVSPMPDGLAAQMRVPPTLCPHCGEDIEGPLGASGDTR